MTGPDTPKAIDDEAFDLLHNQADSNAIRNLKLDDLPDNPFKDVSGRVLLGEHEMRKEATEKIIRMFQVANFCMWGIVSLLVVAELFLLTFSEKYSLESRLINSDVIMVLIGATVVQLGTIMLSMSKFLFPNQTGKE